jgi:hypothetical protein
MIGSSKGSKSQEGKSKFGREAVEEILQAGKFSWCEQRQLHDLQEDDLSTWVATISQSEISLESSADAQMKQIFAGNDRISMRQAIQILQSWVVDLATEAILSKMDKAAAQELNQQQGVVQ